MTIGDTHLGKEEFPFQSQLLFPHDSMEQCLSNCGCCIYPTVDLKTLTYLNPLTGGQQTTPNLVTHFILPQICTCCPHFQRTLNWKLMIPKPADGQNYRQSAELRHLQTDEIFMPPKWEPSIPQLGLKNNKGHSCQGATPTESKLDLVLRIPTQL